MHQWGWGGGLLKVIVPVILCKVSFLFPAHTYNTTQALPTSRHNSKRRRGVRTNPGSQSLMKAQLINQLRSFLIDRWQPLNKQILPWIKAKFNKRIGFFPLDASPCCSATACSEIHALAPAQHYCGIVVLLPKASLTVLSEGSFDQLELFHPRYPQEHQSPQAIHWVIIKLHSKTLNTRRLIQSVGCRHSIQLT